METLVIVAAVAATLLACLLLAGLSRTSRREPLRLPREEAWAENEAAMTRALMPRSASPIDRDAPVLDLEPVLDREPAENRDGAPARPRSRRGR